MKPTKQKKQKEKNMTYTQETPKSIGNIKIIKEIGRGSFGVVFLGQHSKNEAYVAIKTARVSSREENDLEKNQDLIKKEWDTLQRLNHPNIISAYKVNHF